MTMKRTELDKRLGLAIAQAQRLAGNRYRAAGAAAEDRRTRRERERAAGLVPFAVKLPQDLATRLRARAQAESRDLDGLVAELLTGAIDTPR